MSWGWNMGPDFPNLGSQSLKTPTIPGSTSVFRESMGFEGSDGGMGSLPPGWGSGPQARTAVSGPTTRRGSPDIELTRRPE